MSTNYRDQFSNLNSMKWDELVSYKRQLLKNLKETTDKIIDIEKNGIHRMNGEIQSEKNSLFYISKRLVQIRDEMTNLNSRLLDISDSIVKSKNFVVTMQPRLPPEKEADLYRIFEFNQSFVANKRFRNERNKNEAISLMNDASMKLEAIKAIRVVNEQLQDLYTQANEIEQKLNKLGIEKKLLQTEYDTSQHKLNGLFNDKRAYIEEHQCCLVNYEKYLAFLEAVNSRLDDISHKRRSNKEYRFSSEAGALFKVKESVKRKFEAGDKLSFEELKLLYEDD